MNTLLVVTPTLGDSPWLPQMLESVTALPLRTLPVLVAPPTRVAELARRFPAVRVVAEPGGGMYAAINAGLAAAPEWDAFTYLNDDDLLLPRFAQVTGKFDAVPGAPALVVYGGVRLIDARGRRLGAIAISPQPALNRLLYAQRIEPVYQHGTVFSRAVYEKIGGFDASFRYCGDSEYLARACVAGVPFVCATRGEVAAFRLRGGQLTKRRELMIAERHRVDEKLALIAGPITTAHRRARWRFRLANWPVYAERIARHGFVSFDRVLSRAE